MVEKLKNIVSNDATLLFASTIIVNAGNYAINLILGRVLGPEDFAEVSVIATGVLMLSFFAVGLQLTSAKFSATYFAESNTSKLKAFIAWITRKSWIISVFTTILLLIFSSQLKAFFHFSSIMPFVIVLIGIPVYFDFSISRGLMQGTDRFKGLAMTYLIEMIVRLVVTFALIFTVIRVSGNWTTEAVAWGFLASFLATYIYGRRKKDKNETTVSLETKDLSLIKNFVLIIGAYEFSQIMINNSDIMLVKHYFTNADAGLYAALALIGRVVFFATWTIVTLLFPKVIQKEKLGEKHSHLFWGSLAIVATIGISIIIACYFMGGLIITILFGSEYTAAAPLLWKYACATTLFACANVFAYYYMSLSKYIPVVISVVAGALQIGLITWYHETIEQVIWVQIYLMLTLFVLMMIYHIVQTIKPKHNLALKNI